MTEGIIHQVCKKYISNDALSYEAKNTAYQIEQDLIAEIKKASWKTTFGPDTYTVVAVETLIGEE